MRAIGLLLPFVLCGCLSTTTEQDPAGGVDVTFQPSAATMGTPFVTPDGWTITIHQFALRLAAEQAGKDPGPVGVLMPNASCHLRMTGASAGLPGYVDLVMPTLVAGNDLGLFILPPCGVDAQTATRFNQPAEDTPGGELPNLLLEADAVKAGQHLTVSLVVSAPFDWFALNQATVDPILPNVGVPVIFPVLAEVMFAPIEPTGVTFDELAYADADGDGTITGAELAASQSQCVVTTGRTSGDKNDDDDDDDDSTGCNSLLSGLMSQNATHLFGEQPPP